MAVHNVSLALEAMRFFRLEGSQRPVILKPGETKDLIEMSLTPEALEDKILNSYLTIHTNISSINLHLICYHGMVKTVSIACFMIYPFFIILETIHLIKTLVYFALINFQFGPSNM